MGRINAALPHARLCAGFFGWVLLALLAGCAQLVPQTAALRSDRPSGVPQTVELTSVPFFPPELILQRISQRQAGNR